MPDTPSPTPPVADVVSHAAPSVSALYPPPNESVQELDLLRQAVANDWGPRDAYERHWAGELVAVMQRQQLLRRLELKALAATETEFPPTEASIRRLLAFARYGARIDKDLGAALRILRNRPDAWIEETPKSTSELKSRTSAPPHPPELGRRTAATAARTSEPERQAVPAHLPSPAPRTPEPKAPAPMNRHERRRRAAMERKARLAA